jgi:hypothetical protein
LSLFEDGKKESEVLGKAFLVSEEEVGDFLRIDFTGRVDFEGS